MLKENVGPYPMLTLLLALSGLNREEGSQRVLPSTHTPASLHRLTSLPSISLLRLLPPLHFITCVSFSLLFLSSSLLFLSPFSFSPDVYSPYIV